MKCNVCGKRFTPKKENKYIITKKTSVFDALVGGNDEFDCFDCPRCGCQIVAGTRLEKVEESEVACDVCQKKDD